MKRMKRIALCCIMLGGVLNMHAQTDDANQRINAIKMDTAYIYADATMKTLEEALTGAKAILETKMSDWAKVNYPTENVELFIVKAKESLVEIETRRGSYYRAFVYINKNGIIPVTDRSEIAVISVVPETENLSQPAIVTTEEYPEKLTDEELRMLEVYKFSDIEPYIRGLQARGMVRDYGKYKTMPQTGDCYMFIYDRQGNVPATIRRTGGKQLNLSTLKEDNVSNYKNCGAIWFRLK